MVRYKHQMEKIQALTHKECFNGTLNKYLLGFQKIHYSSVVIVDPCCELSIGAQSQSTYSSIVGNHAILTGYQTSGTTSSMRAAGDFLRIKAPAEKDGLKFKYFIDAIGDIVSYSNDFTQPYFWNDIITPVYGNDKFDKKPIVHRRGLGYAIIEKTDDDITYTYSNFGVTLPEEYKLVKYGVLSYGFTNTKTNTTLYKSNLNDIFVYENYGKNGFSGIKASSQLTTIPARTMGWCWLKS